MANTKDKTEIIPVIIQTNDIGRLIYTIREKQIMLDYDLAALYGYEVKRLNEQVKRNVGRFPDDFMFQLTKEEVELVKSQIATSPDSNFYMSSNLSFSVAKKQADRMEVPCGSSVYSSVFSPFFPVR